MANVFPPVADSLLRWGFLAVVALLIAGAASAFLILRSTWESDVGRNFQQPIPFSHLHHVGDVGLDCRYCHTSVETSASAGMPATKTCLTCHSRLFAEAPMLAPLHESLQTGEPLRWTRVHRLPDFVFFDHSVHVSNGVGCTTCHGAIDEMPLTHKAEPMTMGWCLDCHRDPAAKLRPPDAIFSVSWNPPVDQASRGRDLMREYGIHAAQLTDCTICHR